MSAVVRKADMLGTAKPQKLIRTIDNADGSIDDDSADGELLLKGFRRSKKLLSPHFEHNELLTIE